MAEALRKKHVTTQVLNASKLSGIAPSFAKEKITQVLSPQLWPTGLKIKPRRPASPNPKFSSSFDLTKSDHSTCKSIRQSPQLAAEVAVPLSLAASVSCPSSCQLQVLTTSHKTLTCPQRVDGFGWFSKHLLLLNLEYCRLLPVIDSFTGYWTSSKGKRIKKYHQQKKPGHRF